MTISEETIMFHLDLLLANSEPGAALHHLHVIAAPAGAVTPLGLPDPAALAVTVYAIAVTDDVNVTVEEFVAKVIATAAVEAAKKDQSILFAGLAQEAWVVVKRDGKFDDLAMRLQSQGRLSEHPDASEVTVVYGACRDGRRWRGRRWLTGPKAGTTERADLLVGRPNPYESQGIAGAHLVRRLVGI